MPDIRSLQNEVEKLRQLAQAKHQESVQQAHAGAKEGLEERFGAAIGEERVAMKLKNEATDLERQADSKEQQIPALQAQVTQIEQKEVEVNQHHKDEIARLEADTKVKLNELDKQKRRLLGA